jgi:predicted methyltransferase
MTNISLHTLLVSFLLMAWFPAISSASDIDGVVSAGRLDADIRRDQTSHPEAILSLLDLQPGQHVADIFGGGGYYSELMGRLVSPGGEVLLHNNQAYRGFVEKGLTERFTGRAVVGVIQHEREVEDMELGAATLDAAIMIMSYHDLYHQGEDWPEIDAGNFLGQILTALKPGGKFLIVDHVAQPGSGNSAAQDIHRITPEYARADITSRGFEFVASSDVLRNPSDDYSLMVFDPQVRGKTDRFVHLYIKPLQ